MELSLGGLVTLRREGDAYDYIRGAVSAWLANRGDYRSLP